MANPSAPAARKKSRLVLPLENFHDALTMKPPGFNAAQKVVFGHFFELVLPFLHSNTSSFWHPLKPNSLILNNLFGSFPLF
jgi:hypothetical protein